MPSLRMLGCFLSLSAFSIAVPCVEADLPPAAVPLGISIPDRTLETGGPLSTRAVLNNLSDQAVDVEIEFVIQRDASLYSKPVPHPLYGPNVALGQRSWAEGKGEPVVESNEAWGISNGQATGINAMTDGHTWSEFGTVYYNKDQWTETFGYIDLGKVTRVVHLSADNLRQPDKTGKVDFSASLDGKGYVPVDGMQGVDFKKFGHLDVPVSKPFQARFIRMRLHQDGALVPFFRYPAEVQVYGGIDDGALQWPQSGEALQQGKLMTKLAAKGAADVEIGDGRGMSPGAYLIAIRTKSSGLTQLAYGHLYVMSPQPARRAHSRFGINVTEARNAELLKRAGASWARFELKWPAVSAAPGEYKFDGYDAALRRYHENGFASLPCLFQTPGYLVPKPLKDPKAPPTLHPPSDLTKYGEFVFQTVARYGSQKHSADVLLSPDDVSGLGYVDTYELWNEPNKDNMGKAGWRGPLDEYFTMFRIGAEAAKKGDPAAKIANGGWTHVEFPLIDKMRSFKYPDGKCPLDFTDVLSAHYFSYRVEPELATTYDVSHHHEGFPYERTIEHELEMLVTWRDKHKPGLPIWITAAGHDGMGVGERLQAAWLPRGTMTALAAGVDKVQVYQEKGGSAFQSGATGILRDDDSPKPAWFTYATMVRQLEGVSGGARRLTSEKNVRAYLWKRGDQLLVTAWAVKGRATLDLPMGKCTMTDAFGAAHPTDLARPLELTEFPVYLTDFADPAIASALQERAQRLTEKTRRQAERQAKFRAYLFNFGQKNPERVATLLVGDLRTFTPVTSKELYDESKGYGFEVPGRSDGLQPYYQHPLTETFVGAVQGTSFKFRAEPGEYVLQLCTRPSDSPVKLRGLDGGGEQVVRVAPKGLISQSLIKVGSEPVLLETTGACGLVWMSLVQVDSQKD